MSLMVLVTWVCDRRHLNPAMRIGVKRMGEAYRDRRVLLVRGHGMSGVLVAAACQVTAFGANRP